MHQTDGAANSIDEVDRTTIGDVYSKTDIRLIRDRPVAIFEAAITRKRRIDDGNLVAMNLLGRGKRASFKAELTARAAVYFVEICQHHRFVIR